MAVKERKSKMEIQRHMHEICPFRVGQRVTVKPGNGWLMDWVKGEWVVVGIQWEYQCGDGRVNIAIASDDEIEHGHGATDGFRPDDLMPVVIARPKPTIEELEAILADPTERKIEIRPDGSIGVDV